MEDKKGWFSRLNGDVQSIVFAVSVVAVIVVLIVVTEMLFGPSEPSQFGFKFERQVKTESVDVAAVTVRLDALDERVKQIRAELGISETDTLSLRVSRLEQSVKYLRDEVIKLNNSLLFANIRTIPVDQLVEDMNGVMQSISQLRKEMESLAPKDK